MGIASQMGVNYVKYLFFFRFKMSNKQSTKMIKSNENNTRVCDQKM